MVICRSFRFVPRQLFVDHWEFGELVSWLAGAFVSDDARLQVEMGGCAKSCHWCLTPPLFNFEVGRTGNLIEVKHCTTMPL